MARAQQRPADVTVINCGSIVQFMATTNEGLAWLRDNTDSEGWQWMGRCLCVDHRYAGDLAHGLAEAGLLGG